MDKEQIIKEIKKLNPFLWAEEQDATRWNKLCKDNLILAYKDYMESEERLTKITKRVNSFSTTDFKKKS